MDRSDNRLIRWSTGLIESPSAASDEGPLSFEERIIPSSFEEDSSTGQGAGEWHLWKT